jgi:cell division protein FtsW (lipid II flippase)
MSEKTLNDKEKYLNEVLSYITPKELKNEIALEIRCHLSESIQEGQSFGLSEEQATITAIEKMGPPGELGKKLADIHRPRLNAWIIGPTLVLVLVGWLAMYSVGRLGGQLMYCLLGLAIGALFVFLDFSKLKRFAVLLFGVTFCVAVLATAFGPKFLGQPYIFLGPVRIKIMDACPFLFVLALAAMMTREKWVRSKDSVLLIAAAISAQFLFFFTNSLPSLVLFSIAMMAVMHSSRAKYWQTCLVGIGGAFLTVLLHNPDSFVSANAFLASQVEERHTDYVLAYLMASFGRVSGAIVLFVALLLWVQLLEVIKGIRAETPRLVVVGIAALLGSEFGWSMLANLGWAPMPVVGINFPLISFGGTLLVVHLASIGLTLSAYRRRTFRLV